MSNTVPDGWTYTELGDFVAESSAGEWGKEAAEDDNDIPVIRSTNFTNSGIIDYSKLAYRNIDEKKRLKKSLKQGDMVLEKSGGSPSQPVGRVVYFDKEQPFLYSNFTQRLSPVDECDSKFLFYKFYAEYQNGTVLKFQQQTTGIINFQLAEYLGYKSVFPPLPEQQKIAAILSSVDDVIEKTRAQIDKLKDLKTGMMQELLTKGIGSGGVPHTEFKDSPVGRIPEGWDVVSLGTLASFVTSGSRGWAQYYSDSGPLFIRIGNLTREHINLRFDDCVYVSPPESAEGKRTQVQLGDVLISITADLGVIGVVNESIGEAYVNQHVSLVRLDQPEAARWVGHFLAFENSQKQFVANNDAGAKSGLNLSAIRNTLVAMPETEERQRIVEALDAVDGEIAKKRQKVQHVMRMKKALMQDLLTGKVRVKVDQKESAVS